MFRDPELVYVTELVHRSNRIFISEGKEKTQWIEIKISILIYNNIELPDNLIYPTVKWTIARDGIFMYDDHFKKKF